MPLLSEVDRIENGRLFTKDAAGDKSAYRGYLITQQIDGDFNVRKDDTHICTCRSMIEAKGEIDKIATGDSTYDARSLTKSKYYQLVKEGQLEPEIDFYGSNKDLVDARWAATGKRETIQFSDSLGTPEDQERLKVLRNNLEAAKRSSDMEGVKELQKEIDDLEAEIARKAGTKELMNRDSATFTAEEAKKIGESAGVDFAKTDINEYQRGLAVEQEHNDLTNGDPIMTSKIVVAHLNEIPDYYSRLEKMEHGAETKDGISEHDWHNKMEGLEQKLKEARNQGYAGEIRQLEKQIEELRNTCWEDSSTKDGGPGSGQKGHKTSRQVNHGRKGYGPQGPVKYPSKNKMQKMAQAHIAKLVSEIEADKRMIHQESGVTLSATQRNELQSDIKKREESLARVKAQYGIKR